MHQNVGVALDGVVAVACIHVDVLRLLIRNALRYFATLLQSPDSSAVICSAFGAGDAGSNLTHLTSISQICFSVSSFTGKLNGALIQAKKLTISSRARPPPRTAMIERSDPYQDGRSRLWRIQQDNTGGTEFRGLS